MSIDTLETNKDTTKSPEQGLEIVTFEEYRDLCEAVDPSYRLTGIFDKNLFYDVVNDPLTIFATTNSQKRVPAVVPMKDPYYSLEAIERLTGVSGSDCLFLSVPITALGDMQIDEDLKKKTQGKPVLLEVTNNISDEQLGALGCTFGAEVRDFIDIRITDDPEGQKASFSLFGFDASIRPEESGLCVEDATFASAWEKYKEANGIPDKPTNDSNVTYVYSGGELKNNPTLLAHLWRITQHGFGSILGAYHPVSMDVDEEFFLSHITHPNNHIAVRFLDGKPACYGTMTQDFGASDWMQRDVLEAVSQKEKMLFSEVISGEERGMRLSPDVTKTLADVCSMMGVEFTVLFESTNLSERIVIPIVKTTFNNSTARMTSDISRVDSLRYKYLLS